MARRKIGHETTEGIGIRDRKRGYKWVNNPYKGPSNRIWS